MFDYKYPAALIGAAFAAVALTAPVHAQEVVLRFAHEAPETTTKGQAADKLAELVTKYTRGEVEVQVFPGGQLVPTTGELRAVSRGQIDIAAPYTSYFSAIDKAWDVLYMPMLFESPKEAVDVFAGTVGRGLLDRVESSGLVGLSIWHDGPVYLFTKNKVVKTPSDMAGLKIRVAPSAPLEALIESASATPIALPATDVYLALQQGVANAVATTSTYAGPARWNEVLENGTRVLWGWGGYGLVMNQKSLTKLSESQREGFMRAVEETAEWNQEQALANITYWENWLEDQGLAWYSPTEEELAQWKEAGGAIWKEQPEIIQELIAEIRK